jgi:LacI family transcriptional regulator
MNKPRPTIRDVAALAGVSHQTVSRVINESERVNPETRARVEAAIEELSFVPNAIARSMAQGRTFNLACFSPNLIDYTFAQIIEAAESEVRQHGYFLFACAAPDESSFAALWEQMVEKRRVDGIIVINPYMDGRHTFMNPNFPTVIIGSNPRGDHYSAVNLDNKGGGVEATRHLLSLGHQRLATITGPLAEDVSRDRLNGFQAALQASGYEVKPDQIVEGDWSATSGYRAFQVLWESYHPTAIFAQNDRMAIGVIRAARDAGLRVPEDLSVIGFDDMPLASYFDPPLTTLRQDMMENGREAARLLLESIEQPDTEPGYRMLSTQIVIRNTTQKLNDTERR